MPSYDLHCHSTASDGSCSPSELVEIALDSKLDYLALTDHDTTKGIGEAIRASEGRKLCVISGVEISVTWEEITVHILGLGIDPEYRELQLGLQKLIEFREHRAREISQLLDTAGLPDTYQACERLAKGGLISRTHFAQVLIERGHAKDMKQVFKKFLVKNRPGYVPGQWASLQQAVQWIKAAGGLAVIAHPARYKLSAGKLRKLIEQFIDLGGSGIEVVSGSHSDQDCLRMAEYVRRYELYASVGSDFHGLHHPWRQLGKCKALPEDLIPIWQHSDWPSALVV